LTCAYTEQGERADCDPVDPIWNHEADDKYFWAHVRRKQTTARAVEKDQQKIETDEQTTSKEENPAVRWLLLV